MLKHLHLQYRLFGFLLLAGCCCSAQGLQVETKAKARMASTLSLPVRDDFSNTTTFPDQSVWLDSNVYINSDFPLDPISIGVATFDGSDKRGKPYQSLLKKSYGVADYLTSKPINLFDNAGLRYTAADSIYLSFYYQPQGRGDAPSGADSLVVEFRAAKSANDTIWRHAWSSEGSASKSFKAVIIPVTDTTWLKNNFQFRFKNYTTYSGNLDHWNLDYVVLDAKRNRNDTLMNEITWVERSPSSLLKHYHAMPWKHFLGHEATELLSTFDIRIRNNSNSSFTTFYRLDVKDENGVVTSLYPGPTPDKKSAITPNANSYLTLTGNVLPGPFPDNGKDSASFVFEKILSGSASDIFPGNDVLTEKINFFNYYAYDDGTAESGFGMNESGAKLAMQYNLTKPDTIQAVSMYFNQMATDVSGSTFKITIWDDLDKDHILYQGSDVTPVYENTVNGFHTYKLEKPIFAAGTIYVGWVQNTQLFLNLGRDLNANISNDLMKYYIPSAAVWNSTVFHGAWMLRLVVGKKLPLILGEQELSARRLGFSIFPNPADHTIYFEGLPDQSPVDFGNLTAMLSDGLGRVLITQTGRQSMDISNVAPGLYFLQIANHQHAILETHKIVVSR